MNFIIFALVPGAPRDSTAPTKFANTGSTFGGGLASDGSEAQETVLPGTTFFISLGSFPRP